MLKVLFFIITVLVGVDLSTPASAQTQSRFDQAVALCKLRAATYRKAINLRELTRADYEADFAKLSPEQWRKFLASCPGEDARFVDRPAPPGTLVERPDGPPTRIVPRPREAPIGVFYRCNGQTRMPDPNGRQVCGPVSNAERQKPQRN